MRKFVFGLMIVLAGSIGAPLGAKDLPFVNWENHPIHPLDLSPDGRILAVAHTADNRVQLFDVSEGHPVFAGHVVVGVDPVSVRFRSNDELWAVNNISDSISIIDVPTRSVTATLDTLDEPFDVVFAGTAGRAFVFCSQANAVQVFNPANLGQSPTTIDILGEDPRALAVSPDGSRVYVAIFESGNATTVIAGATEFGNYPPNGARDASGPYGGVNPPPNQGSSFSPPMNPQLSAAPKVAQIVRKDAAGRWMDDNNRDWTAMVSGSAAPKSGRVPGWDMPDRDIAVINSDSLAVSYFTRLMNIAMALAVNPATAEVTLVGTQANNQLRFEPNDNGTFLRTNLAVVSAAGQSKIVDLNPHLDYSTATISQSLRNLSIGDPRGIAWSGDGKTGFVAGMGSDNVVVINADGSRRAGVAPIDVGEGPVGLQLSSDGSLLYVWNHMEVTLSVVDTGLFTEVERIAVFNPLPQAIRLGRPHLYNTHETSGLGQLSCASCHVDARSDYLAWDLGNPAGEMKTFAQNCSTNFVRIPCTDFHPMKGPMTTQPPQDIIGKEPFHWRGGRDGVEEFSGTFTDRQGDDAPLSSSDMQELEDFLATITIPPNPFREFDNQLSTNVPLDGHLTSGRFAMKGQPLGSGNAKAGLALFTNQRLDLLPLFPGVETSCAGCHSFPTGYGSTGKLHDPFDGSLVGGSNLPVGPNGENHLQISGASTLDALTMKVPQLRTLYEKVGFNMGTQESKFGVGFTHDGAVDTLSQFLSLEEFDLKSDQQMANVIAFLLSFSGSDLPDASTQPQFSDPPPLSNDTPASVGKQASLKGASIPGRATQMLDLAQQGVVDVVAHAAGDGAGQSWFYQASDSSFIPDDGNPGVSLTALNTTASSQAPVTLTVVPIGLGQRLGLDRDGDGIFNRVELKQGSNPADAKSTVLSPAQGLWYNPARDGHGIDLERAEDRLAATWYTYQDDGTPTWYQAVGPFSGASWTADMLAFRLDDSGGVVSEVVGTMNFEFNDATSATFNWTLGNRSGSEPFVRFQFSTGTTLRNYTGLWFDPNESGYGLSVDTIGNVRVAVAYFYDANNDARWVIGQSDNALASHMDMQTVNGFCPDCALVETTVSAGGTIDVEFSQQSRQFDLDMSADYPAVPNSQWVRQTTFKPLTDVPLNLDQ